jgi:FkbM family methyltransferase
MWKKKHANERTTIQPLARDMPHPSDNEEYVRWAYRLLLGREPETADVVKNHPFKNDRRNLVESILHSEEFQRANLLTFPSPQSSSPGAEFDITRLRQRDKRWLNIAELRQWAKAVPVGMGLILCRTLGKYKQYVKASDIGLSPYLIMDGFYEYPITEFIARNVSDGMTVMDIGANFGYYTILMADLVGSSGKVYAFEPNHEATNALGFSLRANNYDRRVLIDTRALWNCSNEQVTFHVPVAAATNARIVWPLDSRSPATDAGAQESGSVTIETVALDDLPVDQVSFIKADIEGAEERLWQGSKRFLDRNKDVIFLLEFNCMRCQDPKNTLEEINQNFSLRFLDEDSRVRDATINDIFESSEDWMLVISRREQID